MREKLRDLENRFWRPGIQTMEAAEGEKAVDGRDYSETTIGRRFPRMKRRERRKDLSLKGLPEPSRLI